MFTSLCMLMLPPSQFVIHVRYSPSPYCLDSRETLVESKDFIFISIDPTSIVCEFNDNIILYLFCLYAIVTLLSRIYISKELVKRFAKYFRYKILLIWIKGRSKKIIINWLMKSNKTWVIRFRTDSSKLIDLFTFTFFIIITFKSLIVSF
jgi:hypothetical protein